MTVTIHYSVLSLALLALRSRPPAPDEVQQHPEPLGGAELAKGRDLRVGARVEPQPPGARPAAGDARGDYAGSAEAVADAGAAGGSRSSSPVKYREAMLEPLARSRHDTRNPYPSAAPASGVVAR